MSDLQDICEALNAIDHDILQMAQVLHNKAQEYAQASNRSAAASRSADGEAAAALARTAASFGVASRHCAQAATALAGASREGQAFIERTIVAAGAAAGGNRGSVRGRPSEGSESDGFTCPSVEEIKEWLSEINPGYSEDPFNPRSSNCGSCASAVFGRLSGRTSIAGAHTLSIEEMAQATGREQRDATPAEIEESLRKSGPGSHAVIGVDRQFGPGHWFNAYYDGRRVVAIDGQTNSILDWPPEYGSNSCPVTHWDAGI